MSPQWPCPVMHVQRAKVLTTLATLLAVTLAGCSGAGEAIEVPAPEWRSGFAWSYAYNESWEYVYSENGEEENYTDSEDGRFIRQVMNTTTIAGEKPVYVSVKQEADRNRGRLDIVYQADLGRVPFGYSYSTNCSESICNPSLLLDFYEADEGEATWPPYLDFPLSTGKSWGDIIDLGEVDDDDFSISIGAAVEGAAVVDLPCGPTKTAKVNIITRPTNLADFEAMIRKEAAEEGFQVDALDIVFEERETVYYSADYQAIVKREVVGTERFYARGIDPEGEPFEFESSGHQKTTEILDGARLSSLPEVPLAELVNYMMGKDQLADPGCLDEAAVVYNIKIDPKAITVNAGEGESATYGVKLDGVESLPDGHTLKWRVSNPSGQAIYSHTGPQLKVALDAPGMHRVDVEAVNGETLVSADAGTLTGDWIATSRLTCPAATTFGVPPCDIGQIPMAPGIKSLIVRAVPTGALGAVPGSSMRVYDSFGQSIIGNADGNGYKVEVTNFDDYLIDGSDWTMQYSHSVGVQSDIDMEITAIYGAPSAVVIAMEGAEPGHIREAPGRTGLRSLERLPW